MNNHNNAVKSWLKCDEQGNTTMHRWWSDSWQSVTALLELKADEITEIMTAQNHYGQMPWQIQYNGQNIFHLVLSLRDVRQAQQCCIELEKLFGINDVLLDQFAKAMSVQDNHGNTPLHYALQHFEAQVGPIFNLLKQIPEDRQRALLSIQNNQAQSAFHWHSNKNVIRYSWAYIKPASSLSLRGQDGNTALHTAAEEGNFQLLLNSTTDSTGYPELGKLLTNANMSQQNVLHLLCQTKIAQYRDDAIAHVVALMGEYATAAIVKQDNKGDSPLHLAAQSGSLPAVTTLVEALGDQTHKVCLMTNHQHQTPIHYAVLHGNSEMLRVLLSTLSSIEKYQLFFPNHQKDRGLFNLARKNHLLGQGVLDHDIDQNTTVWQWLGVLWQMPRPNDAVAEDAQYIMTSKAEVIGPRSIPTPWLNGSSIKMYNTARQKLTQLFATLSQPERLRLIEQHRNDAPQVFQTDNASDAQRAMWEKLGLETTGAVASSKDTWETLDWDRKMQAAFDASLAEVQIPSERNAEARPSDNRHALFSQSNAASAPPSYDEVCTHQTRARSASF